jgi:hypothetical protein
MPPKRGSEKLLKTTLDQRKVNDLLATLRAHGAKIEEWWIYGQPRPDILGGAVRVPVTSTGPLIQELIKASPQLELKIFPKGIPVPDEVIVTLKSQGIRKG